MHSLARLLVALVLLIGFVFAAPLPSDLEDRAGKVSMRKGSMSWFYPGLGNCGGHSKATDMMVALPTSVYAGGKYCNKYITISANGHSIKAKVLDSCPGCGPNQLDVSPAVFKAFAKLGKGVQNIQWKLPA